MGQYYHLVCPEAGTHVRSHPIGAGLKAAEQVWSAAPPAALALLCAAPRSTHPRDLPWAPAGAWAGRAPLMVGDYAESGDLTGREELFPVGEDLLYGACGNSPAPLTRRARRSAAPKDLSTALLPVLERVFGFRAPDLDAGGRPATDGAASWREFVPVTADPSEPEGWGLNTADIPAADRDAVLDFYGRIGVFKTRIWRRPPIHMTLCGPLPAALPEAPESVPGAASDRGPGEALLWVNLDRGEYIDPAGLGDTPDLAGVMRGTAAKAVLAMLLHAESRGGGDFGELGPLSVTGRWRGDRIVLMGARGFKPRRGARITPERVHADWVDISANASAFIESESILGHRAQIEPKTFVRGASGAGRAHTPDPSAAELRATGIALKSPAVADALAGQGYGALAGLRITIVAPLRLTATTAGGHAVSIPGTLAPRLDLETAAGAKIWIPGALHAQIAETLAEIAPLDVALHRDSADAVQVDPPCVAVIEPGRLSRHELVRIAPSIAAA